MLSSHCILPKVSLPESCTTLSFFDEQGGIRDWFSLDSNAKTKKILIRKKFSTIVEEGTLPQTAPSFPEPARGRPGQEGMAIATPGRNKIF
jgi:hypothetical protein